LITQGSFPELKEKSDFIYDDNEIVKIIGEHAKVKLIYLGHLLTCILICNAEKRMTCEDAELLANLLLFGPKSLKENTINGAQEWIDKMCVNALKASDKKAVDSSISLLQGKIPPEWEKLERRLFCDYLSKLTAKALVDSFKLLNDNLVGKKNIFIKIY